jgi:hypothetical protein
MTVREKIGDAARTAAPHVRHGHEQVYDTIRRVAERCAERAHALPLAAAPARRPAGRHRGKRAALAAAGSPVKTVRTVVHHRSSLLRGVAFMVLIALLSCWAFWVYLLPALPGGGLVKRGLTWGFQHIDCSAPGPTPDPGANGLAWSIGHGVRTVAAWDPKPEQIDAAVRSAARATGRAYAAFQAGLSGSGERPMLPAPAAPDVASQVSTGCCATAPGTGTRSASLTAPTILGLAHARAAVTDGTLTGERLVRFVAEGIVEDTSGDPAAVNPTEVDGSHATGLWQLMMPMHASLFGGRDPKDPVANAHAAALLLERQGWGAWDASHPGEWKAHEEQARAAVAAVQGGLVPAGAPCAAGPAAAPAGAGPVGYEAMVATLHEAFPDLRITSTYRPGARTHATGSVSLHALGYAVDVEPRPEVFRWIAANYPNSTELIYTPMGALQLYHGRSHIFNAVTAADHFDHVHWGLTPEDAAKGPARAGGSTA